MWSYALLEAMNASLRPLGDQPITLRAITGRVRASLPSARMRSMAIARDRAREAAQRQPPGHLQQAPSLHLRARQAGRPNKGRRCLRLRRQVVCTVRPRHRDTRVDNLGHDHEHDHHDEPLPLKRQRSVGIRRQVTPRAAGPRAAALSSRTIQARRRLRRSRRTSPLRTSISRIPSSER
jgi:hypothetical protein